MATTRCARSMPGDPRRRARLCRQSWCSVAGQKAGRAGAHRRYGGVADRADRAACRARMHSTGWPRRPNRSRTRLDGSSASGLRSCHTVAWHLTYVLSLLGDRAVMLDAAGGGADPIRAATDRMRSLPSSVAPYTRATVELARYAAARAFRWWRLPTASYRRWRRSRRWRFWSDRQPVLLPCHDAAPSRPGRSLRRWSPAAAGKLPLSPSGARKTS